MNETLLRLERDGRWLVRVDGHDLGTYRTLPLACVVFASAVGCTADELRELVHEVA